MENEIVPPSRNVRKISTEDIYYGLRGTVPVVRIGRALALTCKY